MKNFNMLIKDIVSKKVFKGLKKYPSHGNTNLYDHSINVALASYKFINEHRITCSKEELVKGALLHDFYLYNWHHSKMKHRLFKHPKIALETAQRYFSLTDIEENIIKSHMFPITFWIIPKCKEAWIVCLFDKVESFKEIFKKKS